MNLKKMILPGAIALTSIGAGSLMTQPAKTETPKEVTVQSAEQNSDPLISHDVAMALTAIGLGGLSYLGAKRLDGQKENKVQTNNDNVQTKKEKINGIDEKSLKNIYTVKNIINECNENNFREKTEIYYKFIKMSETNDEEAKKDVLATMKGISALYRNDYEKFLMEVPKLNYLFDKMASTPEEWETKKLNYPHFDKNVSISHYKEKLKVLDTHYSNAYKALDNNQTISFQNECRKIKEELLSISTGRTSEFANAIQILNSLTDKKEFELRTARSLFGKLKTSLISSTSLKDVENIEKVSSSKTNKTEHTNGLDKNNIDSGDTVNVNNFESNITFNNVGGQDEAIKELKKKIMFPLKYPEAFKGQKMNVGAILYGRPGTGKSLLALALANESGANFIKINASDMTTCLHGATEKNWRDLFEKARKQQPCIIFIDEIDSVASKRGTNRMVNYDDVTLNQILALMSDVEKRGDKIFVLGATNRFDMLDSAAKRSGRFGTHIEIKAPQTVKDVVQIFDIHAKGKKLADDINKEDIAKMLLDKKVTGSDIAAIVNDAMENAYIRLGVYDKMDNGTFTNEDIKNIVISYKDLVNAVINYDNINK